MEAVSTVCGLLLLLSSVSHFADFKDSEYHRYVETFMISFKEHRKLIGMVGLVTSIVGKITIGKDRLRLPDALQIPLWLIALCIQQESDSMSSLSKAEPIVLLCNLIASSFCLLLRRKSRTSPSINIRRLSLDVSNSSSCLSDTSKGSVLYSASQVGGDPEEEEPEIIEEDPENLDDTLSELEAVSLGLPASRIQKNSGLFTSSFTNSSRAPSIFSSSSTAQALREKRPLISPAKLGLSTQQRSSTPTKFQVTTTRSPFIVNQRPCLLPKSVNLFPPQSLQNGLPNGSAMLTASPSCTVPRFYSSSARRLQSQQLPQHEDSEKYSDKSGASKQTSVCLVDSTTKHAAWFSIGEFLNSPGFVGFVLGASMIGNVALACYVFRIS